MKEKFKVFLYLYQRLFWYVGHTKNELLKPLGFWNETVLILTFLSVRYHFNPAFTQILLAYCIILVIAAFIGRIVVKAGIVKYNAKITNHQNPELMEILEEIKKINSKN